MPPQSKVLKRSLKNLKKANLQNPNKRMLTRSKKSKKVIVTKKTKADESTTQSRMNTCQACAKAREAKKLKRKEKVLNAKQRELVIFQLIKHVFCLF